MSRFIHDFPERPLYDDAAAAMEAALAEAQPRAAVRKALAELKNESRHLHLLAIGKAAWSMARAASEFLGERLEDGLLITKYGHSEGPIPRVTIWEAGHPVPDENSLAATRQALEMADGLGENDLLIFLISGGGSALFESPLISLSELQEVNRQLLASGADIVSINIIRKRLSEVKGGRFAARCAPAAIFSILLSDVLGDLPDAIASGPAAPDFSTAEQVQQILRKFKLDFCPGILELLQAETPKTVPNVRSCVVGSVSQLCRSAEEVLRARGYTCCFLTDRLDAEAREAGRFLGAMALSQAALGGGKRAYILGGETTVSLRGKGKGGRNQELVLAALPYLAGTAGSLLFSLGSDGTDGPTDAAGAYADSGSLERFRKAGVDPEAALEQNDAYRAFEKGGGLIKTGPTGTNVNDLTVLLIPEKL